MPGPVCGGGVGGTAAAPAGVSCGMGPAAVGTGLLLVAQVPDVGRLGAAGPQPHATPRTGTQPVRGLYMASALRGTGP